MKFAHIADCHIGAWSDPKITKLNSQAFSKAADMILVAKVDFVLISGDLFNNALPGIDSLKLAVEKLKQLNEAGIRVYVIPGSHDYSPSGKTILDVLEKAGLIINVFSPGLDFTIDKTGTKITGILGKRSGLEKEYYENLNFKKLQQGPSFKIFMFHSAIDELRPEGLENIESIPLNALPKGFDYYAGGHVHAVQHKNFPNYPNIVYPGPLFPENFRELEELQQGGFFIAEKPPSASEPKITYQPIVVCNVTTINLDCTNLTPEQVSTQLKTRFESNELINTIVTIRLSGELKTGKITDIGFRELSKLLQQKGMITVLRNTSKLVSPEFKDVGNVEGTIEEIETKLLREHLLQIKVTGWTDSKKETVIRELMQLLDAEKEPEERAVDYESRLKKEALNILNKD